jgi:hypothetical protein
VALPGKHSNGVLEAARTPDLNLVDRALCCQLGHLFKEHLAAHAEVLQDS